MLILLYDPVMSGLAELISPVDWKMTEVQQEPPWLLVVVGPSVGPVGRVVVVVGEGGSGDKFL